MTGSPDWLSRYRDGHRDQVWQELRQLGSAVHEHGLAAQAQEVCDEMARRARRNIDLIVARLTGQGYRFHGNDDGQAPAIPHCPPGPESRELAGWLQQRFGAVPMALISWVRLVGDVWLVGTHPRWPESASADPLVIEVEGTRYPGVPIREQFEEDFGAWQDWSAQGPGAGPFVLPLAPDRLHKENVSGGAPYGIVLPDASAEGLFSADTVTPFVSYLNRVFRNGGFPWPTGSQNEQQVKQALAQDLLPL